MQSKVAALTKDMAAMKQLEVMVENSYKPRSMCYTFKELCMCFCMDMKGIWIARLLLLLYINTLLEACRACVGRAQRKSTVHELCTVHSARRRRKKKNGVTQTPTYVMYITRPNAGHCGASLSEVQCYFATVQQHKPRM